MRFIRPYSANKTFTSRVHFQRLFFCAKYFKKWTANAVTMGCLYGVLFLLTYSGHWSMCMRACMRARVGRMIEGHCHIPDIKRRYRGGDTQAHN